MDRLFVGTDHADRPWTVYRDEPRTNDPAGAVPVRFVCLKSNAPGAATALDKRGLWLPGTGWDMLATWYPRSPRPVPERVLLAVAKALGGVRDD